MNYISFQFAIVLSLGILSTPLVSGCQELTQSDTQAVSVSESRETEAVLGEKDVLIQATAQFVGRIAELRTELEFLRIERAQNAVGTHPFCLRCAPRAEFSALPLGEVAPLRIENATCDKSQPNCPSSEELKGEAYQVLSRELSPVQRVSCQYLLKQLSIPGNCPSEVGSFYDCETGCSAQGDRSA